MEPSTSAMLLVPSTAMVWKGLADAIDAYHAKTCGANKEKYNVRYKAYAVSFVHAVVCTAAGFYSLWRTPEESELCDASDWWRDAFLLSSAGYFLQDLWVELKKGKKNFEIIAHHIFAGTFLVAAAHHKMYTHPLAVLLLNEGSTPFYCRRWDFRRISNDRGLMSSEHRADFVNDIAFLLTFFVCRVVLIPLVWAQTYAAGCMDFSRAEGNHGVMIFFGNVNFPILWAMNLYWFWSILGKAWQLLRGEAAELSTGSEANHFS